MVQETIHLVGDEARASLQVRSSHVLNPVFTNKSAIVKLFITLIHYMTSFLCLEEKKCDLLFPFVVVLLDSMSVYARYLYSDDELNTQIYKVSYQIYQEQKNRCPPYFNADRILEDVIRCHKSFSKNSSVVKFFDGPGLRVMDCRICYIY
jgi:hypothetical protein